MEEINYDLERKIKIMRKFTEFLTEHPDMLPEFLTIIGQKLDEFRIECKKKNDWLLREALGDACHILGMKKRPDHEFLKNTMFKRIREAIFPNGIQSAHHEGEKQFFKRYLADKE